MFVIVELWYLNIYWFFFISLDEFWGGRFVFSYYSIIIDIIEWNKVLLLIYDYNYNKIWGENIE